VLSIIEDIVGKVLLRIEHISVGNWVVERQYASKRSATKNQYVLLPIRPFRWEPPVAVAECEKTTLVAKNGGSAQAERIATGEKVEGRKSHAEGAVRTRQAVARRCPLFGSLSRPAGCGLFVRARRQRHRTKWPSSLGCLAGFGGGQPSPSLEHDEFGRPAGLHPNPSPKGEEARRRLESLLPPGEGGRRKPAG
jgi:hypothetical protein